MSKLVDSKRFVGNARLISILLAMAFCGTLIFTGCGTNDNPAQIDSVPLICEDGEAWLDPPPSPYGLILQEGGMLIIIQQSDDNWYQIGTGSWFTNGNSLTVVGPGGSSTYTYSISGNVLTLDMPSNGVILRAISTKTSGIHYSMVN